MPTGKQALEKLAALATRKVAGVTVTLPGQNDLAFSLRASALHPLQVLENVHQGQVRDEIRELEDPSPDDIQSKEKEVLGKYYLFTITEPLRVNEPTDEVQVTLDTELTEVEKVLDAVKKTLAGAPAEDAAELRGEAKTRLENARATLVVLRRDYFPEVGEISSLGEMNGTLENADGNDQTLRTRIDEADDWAKVRREYGKLDEALDLFLEAAAGLARINMLYSISPFFLFRLLVQFKVEKSGGEVTDGERRNVSGETTALLNEQVWARNWLAGKMNALHRKMTQEEYTDKVFFHVKGGRALDLLLGREGENDWDTSIVINPELPAAEWYVLYNRIHDEVLDLLREAKREFLLHLSGNAQGLIDACVAAEPEAPVEVDADLDEHAEVHTGTAKAEMIDIGIPRRDTIEAFEQWHHTGGTLQLIDQYDTRIPVPGPLYFVDEYVIMVREALSDRSPSLHKTAKRIARMARALADDTPELDDRIGQVRGRVPAEILSDALLRVDSKDGRIKRLMTFLLEGLVRAHHLRELAGLAPVFDEKFDTDGEAPEHDPYPEAVVEGKTSYLEKNGNEEWDASECDDILAHIAFAQKLSKTLEDHLRTRARYFGFSQETTDETRKRRRDLGALVKALYTASAILGPENRLEVQLAVTGSAAAYYHADYSHDFYERVDELDPVTFLDLRYYCFKEEADPRTVLDFFVKEPLRTYVDRPEIPYTRDDIAGMTVDEDPSNDTVDQETLYLTWPEEVDFGDDFNYKPMMVKISVVKVWPEVAFKWGYPVVALPELIRNYVKAAADAGDFEAKYRLRDTAELLQEMITHYERGLR